MPEKDWDMGDSEKDIAPEAAFLASDDAYYIIRQITPVNGGLDIAS